MDLRVKFG